MNIREYIHDLGAKAASASRVIKTADSNVKNLALKVIADKLRQNKPELIKANGLDLADGKKNGLSAALLDRLHLDDDIIESMAEGLIQIAALPDPVGEITGMNYRPSGIQVGKMRVPLGVIGIIYESRPNVTADASALCIKSGNAAILRGGTEAINSNRAIAKCISAGLSTCGLPPEVVQVMETPDRQAVTELISMPEFVDVIIPRGGKSLIEQVSAHARVPVIKHLHGICHVYIDDEYELDKAVAIAFNAKTHRYGVCNAMETLLVARSAAHDVLGALFPKYQDKGVELRGCNETMDMFPAIKPAAEDDWNTEYLAPVLAVKIVGDLNEAIEFINRYSSGHTESIVTTNYSKARRFLREVDSSSVMVNTSTRFADGFEYGLGAEIGISTGKIHVRGPVGLKGLTSQKYIVLGDGHIRQ